MLHVDAKSLAQRGDRLFSKKQVIDSRNQDIAEQFYPERADFTTMRNIGEEFASHLVTGYPMLVRRDLANQLGTMLRPRGKEWFHGKIGDDDRKISHEGKAWLGWSTSLMRRAMYDRVARFTKATKEADNDFSTFGACAISTEMNYRDNALLYRCWHLRDMAWCEDSYGEISDRHRNWKPSIGELAREQHRFDLHAKVKDAIEKRDYEPVVRVRHICITAEEYGWKKSRHPWVSVFLDVENEQVMYEKGSWTQIYTTPRWGTMSVNPYGISPATVVALPDARLLQAMTLTMLDAGERAANPPLIGVGDAIRGDLAYYPGGFTSVDADYDERLGEVLRPLTVDKSGIPFGMEMLDRTAEFLREAFYLNTLSMPPSETSGEMTAFEVGQRVQEYIRNAVPIFEPMEHEYNGQLCEITFETLMREGAFGGPQDIPEDIQGHDVDWAFESPLAEMVERERAQRFLEMKQMVAEAIGMDEGAIDVPNLKVALREALEGIGTPMHWMRSEAEIEQITAEREMQMEAATALQAMQAGADVAKTTGEAAQLMPTAGMAAA